jgi:hypothetical protein
LVPWLAIPIALIVVPLVIDMLVETERERIDRTIHLMAGSVRQNDIDGLLRYIDPDSKNLVEWVKREFSRYRIRMCNITGSPSISFFPHEPDRALAEFRVLVSAEIIGLSDQPPPGVRAVRLEFKKDDKGQWKTTLFEHYLIPELRDFLAR